MSGKNLELKVKYFTNIPVVEVVVVSFRQLRQLFRYI